MLEVGDIVEYGRKTLSNAPETYRVTHHLKRVEDTLDEWQPNDEGSKITKEILLEFREEDRQEQIKRGKPATRRWKLNYCLPNEATHVSLAGIAGAIAPINQCKKIGVVSWPSKLIEQFKKEAISPFWLKNDFPTRWYWE